MRESERRQCPFALSAIIAKDLTFHNSSAATAVMRWQAANSLSENAILREIVTEDLAQPQQRIDAVGVAAGLDNRADFIAEGSRTSIARRVRRTR